MPGFDATGPLGLGQMTGRGLGPCGRDLAFRRGFGRGFIAPTSMTLTKEEQRKILEEEKKFIEEQLKAIEKRLKELV